MDHNSRQQLQIIVQMIQNILDSSTQTDSEVSVMPVINNTVKTKSKKSAGTNTTKKNPAKQRPNAFESMPEMHMHKEDVEIDKKLAIQPPTARVRAYKPISVRCRSCGKNEKVNAAVIPESTDRYKCNKCSTMSGGGE